MYGLYMYIDLDNYQFLHLIGKKKKKKLNHKWYLGPVIYDVQKKSWKFPTHC